MELSGSDQGLKLVHDGCVENLELQPTEACPMTVMWSPSKSGLVIDDVKVSHSGARGVLVLPVRGTSTAAVNVDDKPVVSVIETVQTAEGTETVVTKPTDSSPPVLDGYTVTSLAKKNAIINGPGGSRMVRNGQLIRLAGHEWRVSITSDGVAMSSGRNSVLLVFDRSLSASGIVNAGTTAAESAASPPAAPVPTTTFSSDVSGGGTGTSSSSSSDSSSSTIE
jgi:hypothetical protein